VSTMKDCTPSLCKAFGLSIAVHIVIFGSALAFAHYGGPLFRTDSRSIMISLVGPGAAVSGSADAALIPRAAAVAASHAPQVPDMSDTGLPQTGGTEQHSIAPAPGGGNNGVGDRTGNSTVQEAAAAGGSGTPGYSPEQWDELRSALERAKNYPRLARERGIEGTVLVRFHVLPSGEVDTIDVVKSSGAKVLDDASVRTVLRAAPVRFVEGWVEVPMVYQLKN
jgi:TonB family protein